MPPHSNPTMPNRSLLSYPAAGGANNSIQMPGILGGAKILMGAPITVLGSRMCFVQVSAKISERF